MLNLFEVFAPTKGELRFFEELTDRIKDRSYEKRSSLHKQVHPLPQESRKRCIGICMSSTLRQLLVTPRPPLDDSHGI